MNKFKIHHQPNLLSLVLFACLSLISCKKYLDKSPDKAMVIPTTIQDASSLLDYYDIMNGQYPYLGGFADDDYFILDAHYGLIDVQSRNLYIWAKETITDQEWRKIYQKIAQANVSLETLEKIQPNAASQNEYHRVKGSALFYRAYAHFHAAQYYAEPYDKATATQTLGIPLRLTADISTKSVRATQEQTYQQIISDFEQAAKLLPLSNPPLSRPNKAAAFAALARTYLTIGDYSNAKAAADSCLKLKNDLLDYNNSPEIDPASITPFQRFNKEVIFQAVNDGQPVAGRVVSNLYDLYAADDIRKSLFFRPVSGGLRFRGNYDGTASGNFSGLAVDEIYLIRAECNARLGNIQAAMDDLNTLIVTRYINGTFTPYTALDKKDALDKVLLERRKELTTRGLRWYDLRRLNKEPGYEITLTRTVAGQTYTLPPNDPRYTFYIPQQVIDLTGMAQNKR